MARHELTLVPGLHTLLTVCTPCSACVATESYVHVGFCNRGALARGRAQTKWVRVDNGVRLLSFYASSAAGLNPYSQLFGRSLPGPIDAMLSRPSPLGLPHRSADSRHFCRRTPTCVDHLARGNKETIGIVLISEVTQVVDLGLVPHGGKRISSKQVIADVKQIR
jgi:hypothetical protein